MGREKGPLPITTTLVVLEGIEGEVSAVTEPRRLRKMPPSVHTASKEEQARAVIVPPLVVRCEADRERESPHNKTAPRRSCLNGHTKREEDGDFGHSRQQQSSSLLRLPFSAPSLNVH